VKAGRHEMHTLPEIRGRSPYTYIGKQSKQLNRG
jgi:hypothetical protein